MKIDYLTIPGWMYDIAKAQELDVFEFNALAVIYSFSRDGESVYRGGRNYLAEACFCSPRKVSSMLAKLEELSLIVRLDYTVNGIPAFKANVPVLETYVNGAASQPQAPEPAPAKTASRFVAPTASEVTEYARTIGYELDGQNFVDFYAAKGWKVGNSAMKDWKACVRTWKSRHQNDAPARSAYRPYQTQAREGLAAHNSRALQDALNYGYNPQNTLYDEQ